MEEITACLYTDWKEAIERGKLMKQNKEERIAGREHLSGWQWMYLEHSGGVRF